MFVVSGSLKHRFEKLGTEIDLNCATDGQRILRHIVLQHRWEETIQEDHRERPAWANGAFIYCNPQHAKLVQGEHEHFPFQLQSKHIICSPEYATLVKEVLAADLDGGVCGRQAFLRRRAGCIKEEWKLDLTVGSQFGFLMLDKDVVAIENVPIDILEYLTMPESAQSMEPDMWDETWKVVCEQNDWLEIQNKEEMWRPFCKLCSKDASVQHLLSAECSGRRTDADLLTSPLLDAILEAARNGGSPEHVQLPKSL